MGIRYKSGLAMKLGTSDKHFLTFYNFGCVQKRIQLYYTYYVYRAQYVNSVTVHFHLIFTIYLPQII